MFSIFVPLLKDSSASEICNLDGQTLFLINEDVFRLEIPMDYVLTMAICHCCNDLLDDDGCILLFKKLSRRDFIEELAAGADFCDEVVSLVIFVELIQFDNVWMV